MEKPQIVNDLIQEHIRKYGEKPADVFSSPGRVNLIGEHVDHQGFSVLPVAINHSICVARRKTDSTGFYCFTVEHVNPNDFAPLKCKSLKDLVVSPNSSWHNYLISAMMGVLEYVAYEFDITRVSNNVKLYEPLNENVINKSSLTYPKAGIHLLIDGDVPLAAGVSSSSALVVGVVAAICKGMGLTMELDVLARLCALCERYCGTAGGGMDQAAICLSKPGEAKYIHFDPLTYESIELPKNGVFVVCNTGVAAPKAVSAAVCYNKRVFELKLACLLMMRSKIPHFDVSNEELMSLTVRVVLEKLGMSLKESVHHDFGLPKRPISRAEARDILGSEKLKYLLERRVGSAVWDRNTYFTLQPRVEHVIAEELRVEKFVEVCLDASLSDEEKLKILGDLMNQSDSSLTLLFDCGCPELDDCTTFCRELGAYGSRLTGAGWGGCTVSLVDASLADSFIVKMRDFFERSGDRVPLPIPKDYSSAIFAVKPGPGLRSWTLED